MWLVLCRIDDESALSLIALLERSGISVRVLTDEAISNAKIAHSVGAEGVETTLLLEDGEFVCLSGCTLAINRLRGVPSSVLNQHTGRDRAYVRAEWEALLTSVVAGIPGVVLNPPSGDSVAGFGSYGLERLYYASLAGLPVMPTVESEDPASHTPVLEDIRETYIVVGDEVLPPAPEDIAHGCRRLANIYGRRLLQVDFGPAPNGERCFATCSSFVEFRVAPGEALIAALEGLVASRRAA